MLSTLAASGLLIRGVELVGRQLRLQAEGLAAAGTCPACGQSSTTVHDRYQRKPRDLPWRGTTVHLLLTVRRFRCRNRQCPRVTFAEDFGDGLPRRAQRTAQASALLWQFACIAGGEAGARLAEACGLPSSPDTLLRLLRRVELPASATPRILGIDDLALRRGQHYATLFIDLETHRPIDLREGRDAEVVAEWLRHHPGVEVIARDRSGAYAEGGRAGAPDALQVADRFHLVQNAGVALEDVLRSRRRQVEILTLSDPTSPAREGTTEPAPSTVDRPPSPSKQQEALRRARRVERWEQARSLAADGMTISAIARALGSARPTVRRLLATPEPPRNRVLQPRPTGLSSPTLQPFASYLQDRWQEGCHNISGLYREIAKRGYAGSRSLVAQALVCWREPRPPPQARRQRRRVKLRWLCLRPPEQLKPDERQALEQALQEDSDLAKGYDLLQHFRALIAARDLPALNVWLTDATASGLPSFAGLANGIEADRAAVEAAFLTPWSTGMVEGHVHRVKLIKRQGYGRAKLDLLRRRVLAS